jgi:hypothetical protein
MDIQIHLWPLLGEAIVKERQKSDISVILIYLFLLVVSFNFSGCATMKKEECLTVDWYSIGYEDGARGYKTSRIGKHRKSCAKYGVMPDLHVYQRGHSEGLKEYCTPHKGYWLGLKGRSYNDVCQGELNGPFLEGYNIGRDFYLFKQDISKEQKNLDRLDKKRLKKNDLLKKKEAELSRDCAKQEKCKQILNDIRILDRKKRRLHLKIKSKKNLIDDMKQTLSDMKARNRF